MNNETERAVARHLEQEDHENQAALFWKLKINYWGRWLCRIAIILSLGYYGYVALRAVALTFPYPERKWTVPDSAVRWPKPVYLQMVGSPGEPLSVLDLDLVTDQECAANWAALQNKEYGKLRGPITTPLTSQGYEWKRVDDQSVNLCEEFTPTHILPTSWKIFSLTATTLADSRSVREKATALARMPEALASSTSLPQEPLLFPIQRSDHNIYCVDVKARLFWIIIRP